MGIGDELMAAGEARRARERHGCPVAILDRDGKPRWHEAWAYCPDVLRPELWQDGLPAIRNAGWCRPYIDYTGFTKRSRVWRWRPYRPAPARILLPADLLHWAEQYRGRVVIEKRIKPGSPANKQWGRWAELEALRPDLPWFEMPELPSFAHALAVLCAARAAVLPEGGLHHGAAAVGCKAVVIFGGFISPAVTGYDQHRNIFTGGEACGNRDSCDHCRQAMAKITPQMVLRELEQIL